MPKTLSTQPYKGVRDFYPAEAARQQYIFSTWAMVAERFGFVRYDASVLEPAELYQAKGAENQELASEQTYTFTDRGERAVTLRPEMTPTVARLIAGRAKELAFPARWYAIPNLFRYERPQRGRLREHWQLNCDIFGGTDLATDVEIIALAYDILKQFGASDDMFTIQVNDRALMERLYRALNLGDEQIRKLTRLNDRRDKIAPTAYRAELINITDNETVAEEVLLLLDNSDAQSDIVPALAELGINNVVFNKSLARGFDYYTGTIFEFMDNAPANRRSLLGGGRYDNLTSLFGGEAVPGVGFGFGDVALGDFLETHDLLPTFTLSPTVVVAPVASKQHLAAQQVARVLRTTGLTVAVDSSPRQIGKKLAAARAAKSVWVVVVGEQEVADNHYELKNVLTNLTHHGCPATLAEHLTNAR